MPMPPHASKASVTAIVGWIAIIRETKTAIAVTKSTITVIAVAIISTVAVIIVYLINGP
jgi:hypothetical protein